MNRYLAVDLGASGGKALLGCLREDGLELEEIHRFSNRPVEIQGVSYWDILSLYDNILQALNKAALAYGGVSAIGIDSWGVDIGLLDGRGRLLANPRHYRNMIGTDTMGRVTDQLGKEWIFQRSPTQFQPFNTLYQLAQMEQEQDPLLQQAQTVLNIPALLSYFLCGSKSAEFTMATTTQMYNPEANDWDRELLSKLSLDSSLLPAIVPAGTVIGSLLPSLQTSLGMQTDVILPATHDTGAAVASIDPGQQDTMFISTGTWCLAGMVLDEPRTSWDVVEYNFANEGCWGGKYRLLYNGTGLWLVQQLLAQWRDSDPDLDYGILTDLARRAEPFVSILDVNTPSLQKMGDMEHSMRAVMNAPEEEITPGVLVRTALEGVALRMAWTRDVLESITGCTIRRVHMVGGGIRNELLCQFVANATNLPVVTGPVEATAVGNLLGQMAAAGEIPSMAAGQRLVARSLAGPSYEPQDQRLWEEAYGAFRTMIG